MSKQVRFAGFWVRLIADFIDSLILDIFTVLVILIGFGLVFWIRVLMHRASGSEGWLDLLSNSDSFLIQICLVGARGALTILYFSWGTFRYGTTLGKRFVRVSVVSRADLGPVTLKQSLIRCFSYPLSYLPLGAGFLMTLFNHEKLALHDRIAGTVSLVNDAKG